MTTYSEFFHLQTESCHTVVVDVNA